MEKLETSEKQGLGDFYYGIITDVIQLDSIFETQDFLMSTTEHKEIVQRKSSLCGIIIKSRAHKSLTKD